MTRSLLLAMLFGVVAATIPAAAFAHARLLASTPADGAVLAAPPHALVLRFDDPVSVGPSIAAVDAGGRSVTGSAARTKGRALTIPLRISGNGSYDVRWSVISDDGHTITGVVAFTVGTGFAATHRLTAGGGGPPAEDVLGRFLLLAGLLVAVGATAFLLLISSVSRVAMLAACGFGLAGIGAVVERTRTPGGTRFAHAMELGITAAIVGLLVAAVSARRLRTRLLLVIPALALTIAPPLGGHALDSGVSHIQLVFDVGHLAAAAVWIGGVAALAVALTPHAARRFSRLALGSVALLAVTGLLRAWSELASFGQLFSTGFGRAIVVKTVLFAALLVLAYVARTRLLERRRLMRRSLAGELTLLAGVVVAVAFLTSLPPGRVLAALHNTPIAVGSGPPPTPPRGALTLAAQVGDRAVAVAVQRVASRLRVTTTVLGPEGKGVDGLSIAVNGNAATRCGFGCYRSVVDPPRMLHLTGAGAETTFALPPPRTGDARALLKRIGDTFMSARTTTFHERLSSGPGQAVESDWKTAAPDSLSFRTTDGSAGVVIGGRRWDRQGRGPWLKSIQDPRVPQPQLPWTASPIDVAELQPTSVGGAAAVRLSFVDPATPAWFTVTADARTLHVRRIDMIAAAHFMRDDYRSFDTPVDISPPAAKGS
jgi:copper transport protein